MMRKTSVFIVYFLSVINLIHSRFNAEEINSVSYDISILNVPVSKSDGGDDEKETDRPKLISDTSAETFYIGNKNGQQYVCTVPSIVESVSDSQTESERRTQSIKNLSMTEISDILGSLESKKCLTKTVGWWTYEFCYNKAVYQYHIEGGRIVDEKIVLGRFESDRVFNETYLIDEFVRRYQTFYHSQYYTDGSLCNLSSKLRKTEVRFFCNDEDTYRAELQRVDEPETCQYIVHVHIPGLCKLAAFYPIDKKRDPLPIDCRPFLSDTEYQMYKQQQQEEKEKAELEKLDKNKQIEKLEKKLAKLEADQKEFEKEKEEDLKEEINMEGATTEELLTMYNKNQQKIQKLWQRMETLLEDAVKDGDDDVQVVDLNVNIDEDGSVTDKLPTDITTTGTGSGIDTDIDETLQDSADDSSKDYDDEALLADFEKELKKIFAKGDASIPVDKKALKGEAESQYDEIIKESREEVAPSENTAVTDDQATHSLASTLNKLIDKLDKAEREIEMANEQLEEAEQKLNAASRKLEKVLQSSSTTSKQNPDKELKIESETAEETSETASTEFGKFPNRGRMEIKRLKPDFGRQSTDNDRVKVRVSKIKSEGLPDKAYGKVSEESQNLEAQLAAKLKKAGLDVKGGRVQVKIITSGYYDEETNNFHMLSEDESQQFSNIILSLLGGDEQNKEEKRHKNLEDNYNFKFKH